MPRRGYSPRGQSGKTRRLTDWGIGPGGVAPTNFIASGSALLGAGMFLSSGIGTLVRIRGLIAIDLIVATSAGDGFFGAVGIAMVQTTAFTAGIVAFPTPVLEANSDAWLWHSYFDVRFAKDGAGNGAGYARLVVDSKAMRKMEGDENTLYAACELTEVGAVNCDVFFDSRVLIKAG